MLPGWKRRSDHRTLAGERGGACTKAPQPAAFSAQATGSGRPESQKRPANQPVNCLKLCRNSPRVARRPPDLGAVAGDVSRHAPPRCIRPEGTRTSSPNEKPARLYRRRAKPGHNSNPCLLIYVVWPRVKSATSGIAVGCSRSGLPAHGAAIAAERLSAVIRPY